MSVGLPWWSTIGDSYRIDTCDATQANRGHSSGLAPPSQRCVIIASLLRAFSPRLGGGGSAPTPTGPSAPPTVASELVAGTTGNSLVPTVAIHSDGTLMAEIGPSPGMANRELDQKVRLIKHCRSVLTLKDVVCMRRTPAPGLLRIRRFTDRRRTRCTSAQGTRCRQT